MHVNMSRFVVPVLFIALLSSHAAVRASDLQEHDGEPPKLPAGPLLLGPEMPGPRHPVEIPEELSKRFKTHDFIDYCVESAMVGLDAPGAAVAIFRDGELFYEKGYGVKHRNNGGEVTPETYFRIGSITKQLTAAAVMQLVDQGVVDLDDPLSLYVPELELTGRWNGDHIRIRHLLSHTAAYPDNITEINGETTEEALSNWVESQAGEQLHAPPGLFWNYSNPNFVLAGLVVERASGMPYREYMESLVFDAAGLERTTFDSAAVINDGDYSFGHHPIDGGEVVYAPDDYENRAAEPAGWAFSTATDMARWADLLMSGGGDLLSAASVDRMQGREAWTSYRTFDYYGLGIFNEQYRSFDVRQHGGNIPGWGAYLLWIPQERWAVAVLGNTFQSLSGAAYCIVNTTLYPVGSTEEGEIDPGRWHRFEGSYDGSWADGVADDAEVYLENGTLMIDMISEEDPSWMVNTEMIPIYGDLFVVDVYGDGSYYMDLTFISSDGDPWRTLFLRNRVWVGEKGLTSRGGGGPVRP